jgi:hypothetical protein
MAEWVGFAGYNIAQLTAKGWHGVFTWDYADMWYPGYNHGYSFMHNTNARFYELQGARLASPREMTSPGRSRSWYNPFPIVVPFTWHLMDAVNLEEDALKNDLSYTVDHKDELLYNFYLKGKLNMAKASSEPPYAYIVPANGGDNADVTDMINNLQLHKIEVQKAGAPFSVGGRQFVAGDYVILMNQPYGLTAKNFLQTHTYPPIKTPYDVTTWTYGLMRDVETVPVADATFPGSLSLVPVTDPVPYKGALVGGVSSRYVLEHQSNNNLTRALPRLFKNPAMVVSQADAEFTAAGRTFPAGTFVVQTSGTTADHDWLKSLAEGLGLTIYSVTETVAGTPLHEPKIGLYAPTYSTMPIPSNWAGGSWTRVRLDKGSEFNYTLLAASEVISGDLTQYDAIIVPALSTSALITGSTTLPPGYQLGIGEVGLARLKAFAETGGTLVLQGQTARLPVQRGWNLGVTLPAAAQAAAAASEAASLEEEEEPDFGGREPEAGAMAEQPSCPGSLLRVKVDPTTPVGYGYGQEEVLWCESATLYFVPITNTTASIVVKYPETGDLLLSGYLTGGDTLRGKAVIVDAPLESGHVILLAPNVVYRAQTTGSFMFFFNSLISGGRRAVPMHRAYLPFVWRNYSP